MKKKVIRIVAGLFLLSVLILPSCEALEDCGTCRFITDNDGEITTGPPLIFCGDNLLAKQSSDPVTIGNVKTYWDCE